MFETDIEIIIAIAGVSTVILLLAGMVVMSIVRYKHRQQLYEMELKEAERENERKQLLARIVAKENTLNEISAEIHDNIGQILSLTKLQLQMVESDSDELVQANNNLQKGINELRDLSKMLNHNHIVSESLSSLLEQLLEEMNSTGKYTSSINISGEEELLPSEKRILVYRMIQEIINNIIKHAKATSVDAYLHYSKNNINIKISDNGVGFDTVTSHRGVGLGSLSQRAKAINATLSINSLLGKGTTVTINIPYD